MVLMVLMSEFAGLTSGTADMTEVPDTADIIETNEVKNGWKDTAYSIICLLSLQLTVFG